MERTRLQLPLDPETAASLRAGDLLLLSGRLYTARDAAHQKMIATLAKDETLPVQWAGETVYYCGPCPGRPGQPIGSAGPTTSSRMDACTPQLLRLGLRVMIGKGNRSPEVIEAIKSSGAVYLGATGGAGALISQCVTAASVFAYPELGTEAIWQFEVADFPAIVLIDSLGSNFYSISQGSYRVPDSLCPGRR
jgi:fumarate hydratase subunit beta